MAYTVKQLAALSGVSVRTLHFYDETGLLKPAYYGDNGYRFYEEPQLLALQQILFYRELGFELKRIRQVLGRTDDERLAALQSHRSQLDDQLDRLRTLIEAIDKTIQHMKGTKTMTSEEMFAGFRVEAGRDRFDQPVVLSGEPNDCKVSSKDTGGAMGVFEFAGSGSGPRHVHHQQDEWIYVLEGEFDFHVGDEHFHAGPGQSVFMPRNVPHAWVSTTGKPGKLLNIYQPAGTMEAFFGEVGKYNARPQIHEALSFNELGQLFHHHGMDMVGPSLVGEWSVNEQGRIVSTA